MQSWIRSHPHPPYQEHLSFRLGNQLFFVRVIDADDEVAGLGSVRGLFSVAEQASGHACTMGMRRQGLAGRWQPVDPGWGLRNATTGALVDPVALVSDESTPMSAWEMHHLAVQVVEENLIADGYSEVSMQPNPRVSPSIWFVGDSGELEWVVVRCTHDLRADPVRPHDWDAIAEACAAKSEVGHFAWVVVQESAPDRPGIEAGLSRPRRGHELSVIYSGFEDE
ncbi:hypothetical protein [Inhella gelatinilytica]|uniref:Uncharacterized protein n=1 Tax=Inhella gelatinilytica TaxID=2795030 RepID=A0A931J0L6_9BURK|nr:hypothetical protein [Inhella gelatinilytica]MBH9553978.1 hypothetical protein [Inhella gelatinilytica]